MIDDEEPVAEFCSSEQTKAFRITQLYLMFLFTWQGYFRVSDVGMGVILRFISMFLMLLVTAFGLHPLKEFVHQLPKSIVSARGYLGRKFYNFTRYVSCHKCVCP